MGNIRENMFYLLLMLLGRFITAEDTLNCINCHAIVFSDGFMQGDLPSGTGVDCFNGTETNQVDGEANGQCKTVFINEWNRNGEWSHDQVDIKRIWTHETFDNTKVYSWGHYWKDCDVEQCEIKENWAEDFIEDANAIIHDNIPQTTKMNGVQSDSSCVKCNVFSKDRNDPKLVDCMSGSANGEKETCSDGQKCLTYFNIGNMNPPGISEDYTVRRSCENAQMVEVRQYQEHHYCKNDNCNAQVMLGDGPSGGGDGSGNNSDGTTQTATTQDETTQTATA